MGGSIVAVGVLATVLAGLAVLLWRGRSRGLEPELFAAHREPRITSLPPQRVLQIVAPGDPNVVGPRVFGSLMRSYFRLRGVPKGGPSMPAPRARWTGDPGGASESWIGTYAMPVPEAAAAPAADPGAAWKVELATWDYGTVAESLHVGPYSAEGPALEELRRYAERMGYVVSGEHEEEYVRGPGMVWRGDPRRYLTLLRYRVRPREAVAR